MATKKRNPRPPGPPDAAPDLRELLRADADISDFIAAFGEAAPDEPAAARRRALELLQGLDATDAVAVLFRFAQRFARMASEVADYCTAQGAPLGGQMQLRGGELRLDLSGLDSAWAFAGAAPDRSSLDARAHAIAAALEDVAARVDPESLVQRTTDDEVTSFGRALRESSDSTLQAMWRQFPGSTHTVERAACSPQDLTALQLAVEAVEATSAALASVPLSAGATSALQRVQQHLPAVLDELASFDCDERIPANPAVASLADEVQLLASQLRSLGADVTEGARIESGFHDFLRTEFWPARWRLYELWLLVRVLKTLHGCGGRVELHGVHAGAWHVAYGRATAPVASARFAGGSVDVHYQYWSEGESEGGAGADMPDLVLKPPQGRPIAIIDPKHGRSYTRSKVQKVLVRYAALDADLTAIVNYFDMPTYRFELTRAASRTWVLAADIAPDSALARRLELQLADAVHARGFHGAAPVVSASAAASPGKRRAAQAMELLYWATQAREVDEPAGLWRVKAGGEAEPVAGWTAQKSGDSARLDAAPDGRALLVARESEVLLVHAGAPPRVVSADKRGLFQPTLGWSADGSHFALALDGRDRVFDAEGTEREIDPAAEIVGWHPTEPTCFFALRKESEEQALLQLVDATAGLLWEHALERRSSRFASVFAREAWRVHSAVGGGGAAVIRLGHHGAYILDARRELHALNSDDAALSVSPGGHRALLAGPRSDHGRILLRIDTADGTREPLVRYTAASPELLPTRVCWTIDEAQFAFMTRRSSEHRQRLYTVRCGERHARAAALPGQEPSDFAWGWVGLWT